MDGRATDASLAAVAFPGDAPSFPGDASSGGVRPEGARAAPAGRPRDHHTPGMVCGVVGYADTVALLAANVAVCGGLRLHWHEAAGGSLLLATTFGTLALLRLLHLGRAYGFDVLCRVRPRHGRFLACFAAAASPTLGALYLLGVGPSLAFAWLAAAACVYWPVFLATHLVARALLRRGIRSGRVGYRVAVVSDGTAAVPELPVARGGDGRPPLEFVGCHGASNAGAAGLVRDLGARGRHERIDAVLLSLAVALPDAAYADLRAMTADIYVRDPLATRRGAPHEPCSWDGHSLRVPGFVRVATRPLDEGQALRKAAFDVTSASVLLVLLAVPLALVALAIRLDSPGPVLFRQPRVGFNNRLFVVYKFRTMFHHRADPLCDVQTTRGDERVTRVGAWLRRHSVDELPQLFNVLNGSMSLVGPRPHAPNTKAGGRPFDAAVYEYARRHRVKPGITGWAQVNGWRGETRSIMHLEQRLRYDLEYIENWSAAFDLKIIVLTLSRELWGRNAY